MQPELNTQQPNTSFYAPIGQVLNLVNRYRSLHNEQPLDALHKMHGIDGGADAVLKKVSRDLIITDESLNVTVCETAFRNALIRSSEMALLTSRIEVLDGRDNSFEHLQQYRRDVSVVRNVLLSRANVSINVNNFDFLQERAVHEARIALANPSNDGLYPHERESRITKFWSNIRGGMQVIGDTVKNILNLPLRLFPDPTRNGYSHSPERTLVTYGPMPTADIKIMDEARDQRSLDSYVQRFNVDINTAIQMRETDITVTKVCNHIYRNNNYDTATKLRLVRDQKDALAAYLYKTKIAYEESASRMVSAETTERKGGFLNILRSITSSFLSSL